MATALADPLRDLVGARPMSERSDDRRPDAVARPVRGRPGRRADGVHREPVVRPAAVARRHRRVARPRRGLARRRAAHRRRARRGARRARHVSRRAGRRDVRVPRRATRTSTRRSSGASPSSPARPAPSCTPARSRNDQSATDVRLWCKRELRLVAGRVVELQRVLLAARRSGRRRVPARLHPPPAGPAGAARAPPARPRVGARPRRRAAASPRSHGWTSRRSAPARSPGSSLPLDPAFTAAELGFARAVRQLARRRRRPRLHRRGAVRPRRWSRRPLPARRGVGAVDHARSSASPASTTATRRGRRCCRRRRTPTSPSSPAARPAGSSATSPGSWRRSRACRSATTATCRRTRSRCSTRSTRCRLALGAMTGMIDTATFVPERMQAAADSETSAATDLAEWLVVRGVPFREAHAIVGAGAARARRRGRRWPSSSRRTTALGPDAAALVAPGVSVTTADVARGAVRTRSSLGAQRRSGDDRWSELVELDDVPPHGPRALRRVRHAARRVQRALLRVLRRRGRHVVPRGPARRRPDVAATVEAIGFDFMLKKAELDVACAARVRRRPDLACSVARWGNTSFDVVVRGASDGDERVEIVLVYVSVTPARTRRAGCRNP